MRNQSFLSLLAAGLIATMACNRPAPDTVKTESKSKTETPAGTQTTETSTAKVGSTVNSTTETKTKTPDGTVDTKKQVVVGTVTEYTAGKKIEILTGDNDKHSFDLGDSKVASTIDSQVAVGSKVQLTERTDDNGQKTIEVRVVAG